MTPPNHSAKDQLQDSPTVSDDALPAVTGEGAGTASLEKVRDILFGSQMREVERRFARLEERLVKETRDLKDEVKKRLEALELYATRETGTLADQVKQEHSQRSEAVGRIARELTDMGQSLERRTSVLDEQLSRGQRELRQQMLEQHQRLSEDVRQKVDDVLATLAREAHELRTDKTDRQALAALLKEMAMRLTDDFRLPDGEDAGRG